MRRNKIVGGFLIFLLFESQVNADYSISISNPTTDTRYASQAPILASGNYYWNFWNSTPTSVMVRVHKPESAYINRETSASMNTSAYTWTCPTNAPQGYPGNTYNRFDIRAYLFTGSSSSYVDYITVFCKVEQTGGS